jgi:hypothetical protein
MKEFDMLIQEAYRVLLVIDRHGPGCAGLGDLHQVRNRVDARRVCSLKEGVPRVRAAEQRFCACGIRK